MLPLTVGVGLGSFIAGRMISWTGRTAILPSLGLLVTFATLVGVAIFAPVLNRWEIMWLLGLSAFFQGSAMPVAQVTVQMVAGPRQLGVGAASVHLARSLGSAFGVALVGAVLFGVLAATDNDTAVLFTGMVREGPAAMAHLTPGAARGGAGGNRQRLPRGVSDGVGVFLLHLGAVLDAAGPPFGSVRRNTELPRCPCVAMGHQRIPYAQRVRPIRTVHALTCQHRHPTGNALDEPAGYRASVAIRDGTYPRHEDPCA